MANNTLYHNNNSTNSGWIFILRILFLIMIFVETRPLRSSVDDDEPLLGSVPDTNVRSGK
jgi:hypothetical protein